MKSWFEHYQERMNDRYEAYINRRYGVFLDNLERTLRLSNSGRVGEFGCGPGFISKELILRQPRHSYYLFENCPQMAQLTRRNLDGTQAIAPISIIEHDVRKPLPFEFDKPLELAFGHGVLEHYDDEAIFEMIQLQRFYAKVVTHYVPSDKYETRSLGDERLLSADKWRQIAKPDEVSSFNEGHDLILSWYR